MVDVKKACKRLARAYASRGGNVMSDEEWEFNVSQMKNIGTNGDSPYDGMIISHYIVLNEAMNIAAEIVENCDAAQDVKEKIACVLRSFSPDKKVVERIRFRKK